MVVNSEITIYHKQYDELNRIDKWKRYNYDKVWLFGGKGANINKGYENANNVEVRIWYDLNGELSANNFAIGDIIVKGHLDIDITTQQDLLGNEIYNITSIIDNTFGTSKHIHLGGK